MAQSIIRHDEPSTIDQLGRDQYAAAFAQLAVNCETPMVIGLYGGWGLGKTTLMRLIQSRLSQSKCRTVWFDSWLHQYDDTPALALLQAMVQQLGLGEEGKKILLTVATAFSGAIMKKISGVTVKDVREFLHQFEEEHFESRETRTRLRQYFRDIVLGATESGRKRLVIFIDDLDRCSAETTLNMLEALKLYLNLPDCVYFIGVDRTALERSIAHRYGEGAISEIHYLDKIVQLPFSIPPIPPESMDGFVSALLSEPLRECKEILILGLGDNPRRVKRFINTLALNHELALASEIAGYSPLVLSAILLIQYRNPRLYDKVLDSPSLVMSIARGELNEEQQRDLLVGDVRLGRALSVLSKLQEVAIEYYLYLTEVAGVTSVVDEYDVVLTDAGPNKIGVIKKLREVTGTLGLKEAKDLVDTVPQLLSRAERQIASDLVKDFEALGAKALMRPVGV